MTVSILRTADAWWVQTPSGAARIRTDAASTAEVLADRAAIDAAARLHRHRAGGKPELLSPVTTPCRRGRSGHQLRLACATTSAATPPRRR